MQYASGENQRVIACNRAFELLFRKKQEQLIGLTPCQLFDSEATAARAVAINQRASQSNDSMNYEFWIPEWQAYFEVRKIPFHHPAKKQKWLLTYKRNITKQKTLQVVLEKSNHIKTHFISTMSHELRTPLSGIVGLSRLLREEQVDQALQRRYLKTIYLSSLALNHIFNDIISLEKFEKHQITLVSEPLSLPDLFEELEDLGQILVEPKGLTFALQSTEGVPELLLVDGTRLRQIMWNLLSNAVKFTVQGGVTLRIYEETAPTALLIFEIIDSGIGIPASEQSKIFDMHYQVKKQPGLNNPTGTGIGLALSQHLAELMGGSIKVHSQLGQGSCFTLRLPLTPVAQPVMVLPSQPLVPLHLLLIEDMDITIKISTTIIEKLGHTVDVVMSGAEALARFSPNQYHFILLDIQLPDMSGLEVVKRLRATYPKALLPPIVALTAAVLTDNNEYLAQGMMDTVLNKPLSTESLMALIEHHGNSTPPSSRSQTLPETITPS